MSNRSRSGEPSQTAGTARLRKSRQPTDASFCSSARLRSAARLAAATYPSTLRCYNLLMHALRQILLVRLPVSPLGPAPIRGNVPLAAAYLKLYGA